MKVIVFKMYGLAGSFVLGPPTLYIHVGYKNLGNQADLCTLGLRFWSWVWRLNRGFHRLIQLKG